MERLTSFTKEAWGGGARGARTAAGAGVHTTYAKGAEITENTGDAVNNLFNRAEQIQRGFFRALVSEEDGTGDPEENRVQMDGTFGVIGPTHVCLRIEMAHHWELKLAKYVSRAFTLVIVVVIIVLIVLKSTTQFSKLLTRNTYYIWNVAVAGACWALCALTLVSYAHRYWAAKRLDMQWSNRRWRLSLQALALLVVQMINLTFMLVGLSLILPEPCRWRNYASSIMGLLQWTCWNTEFVILVAMAHSLTILRRKKGDRGDRKEGADGLAASRPTSFDSAFRSTMRSTMRSMNMGLSMTRVKGMELVMDAPIFRTVHVEKVVMWVFFQIWPTLLLWSFWGFLTNSCEARLPFQDGDAVCKMSDKTVAFLAMTIVAVGMYMVVYLFFSSRTQDDLESRSYAEMRFVRIAFGVQHSYVLPLFLVLTVSIIVLTSIKIDSCWTYVEEWLGLSAWQAAGTICACTMSYFYTPLVGRDRGVILSLLQDFCWNQKAVGMEKEARDEILKRVVKDDSATKSPMFCVETCIRHLYLANYVYSVEYDRGGDGDGDGSGNEATGATTSDEIETAPSKASEPSQPNEPSPTPGCGNLDDALAIWEADVEDYRVISEPLTDTVALVLWNKNRIALAFKGTSSAQNVKTDLNVFKVVHEPRRTVEVSAGFTKSLSIPQTPYVHRGFWNSWTKEDFHLRIKHVVREYIDTHHDKREANERVEMHVTGHSLGGALATLAALDLTREFDVDTTVYTFGQPRVGNKAFATDYDAAVPRHFSVAHGQDPVARVPKGAYRKNGIRVFTSHAGDVIVSPSSLETHVINATPVVADHFLESYRKAWMASIKQQFGPKSLTGLSQSGRDGALELASEIELGTALLGTNLDVSALESFDTHPLSEEDLHKIKLKEDKERAKQEGREKKEGDGGVPAGCAPGCAPGCTGRPKTAE